jgi:hypothetical protein
VGASEGFIGVNPVGREVERQIHPNVPIDSPNARRKAFPVEDNAFALK